MSRDSTLVRLVSDVQYHVEEYFTALTDWTFSSVWFDLPVETARALSVARARRVRNQSEDPLIQELADQIDQRIKQVGGLAVVRLSTRSAKDVVLQLPETFQLYEQQLSIIKEEEKSLPQPMRDDVREMIALIRAAGCAMCVKSGREAVNMFTESQRIFDDVNTACQLNPPKVLRVLVRQYIPLRSELELRVFVNQKKISAISQYYTSCLVPWLHQNKETVQAQIFQAVESVNSLINIQDFVIDFAFDMEGKLWVVEINLPPPIAGMSMFDKHSPPDMDIVLGRSNFEFRLVPLDYQGDCRDKYQMFFNAHKKKTSVLPKGSKTSTKTSNRLRTSF